MSASTDGSGAAYGDGAAYGSPPVQRTSATFVGMPAFPEAARAALSDGQLRRNLAHATGTIRDKRAQVVAEVAQWEELRRYAAAVKDTTLAHLDEYLLTFEEQASARGATVHWARDAAEANRIVVDLVRAAGTDEVVKVKSMATQEIELNEALAEAGISAWETDLAELIVQLGHDRPSHILVPAIHRNRREIRDIFAREMGLVGRAAPEDLTDDPARLAEAARLHLREKFLRARVAISGANFAVAQTGTLVVVESEGNGRMCLTLPETLISIVGIEKVVPTWESLGPFLEVLPRSSTGERMNPYTSMWTGVHEGDGPQDVHVVLVDNGRTHVLADPVGRQALRCIRCSACLNVCPVYERTGGHAYGSVYPGPIGAILNPQLRGTASPVDASLPYASSLCGACYDVCPVRINIPEVLVQLRTQVVAAKAAGHRLPSPEAAAMGAAGWVFGSSRRLGAAGRLVSGVGRLSRGRMPSRLPDWAPGPLGAWAGARDLPALPTETFRQWWVRTRGTPPVTNPAAGTRVNKRPIGGLLTSGGAASARPGAAARQQSTIRWIVDGVGGAGDARTPSDWQATGTHSDPARVDLARAEMLRRIRAATAEVRPGASPEPPGAPQVRADSGTSADGIPEGSPASGSSADGIPEGSPASGSSADGIPEGSPASGTGAGGIPARPTGAGEVSESAVLDLFAETVADYRAEVVQVPPERVPAAIAAALRQVGARDLVVPTGFPEEWLAGVDGLRRVADEGLSATDLDGIDAVVTSASVGIARTGTIVLTHGPGQGRRILTLVPDVHVCVVRADEVVEEVADAMARLTGDATSPQTWISGPSATSDIELDRVEGVHGPRTLIVILTVP